MGMENRWGVRRDGTADSHAGRLGAEAAEPRREWSRRKTSSRRVTVTDTAEDAVVIDEGGNVHDDRGTVAIVSTQCGSDTETPAAFHFVKAKERIG